VWEWLEGGGGGTHTLEMGNGEMALHPYLCIRGFFERKWLNGVVARGFGDALLRGNPAPTPGAISSPVCKWPQISEQGLRTLTSLTHFQSRA
jgi:hypothetical protein